MTIDHQSKILSNRYLALDVLRGMTIAFMIIVNTPGSWSNLFAPLAHAEWHGFTPTDLVFPTFLFVVGNAMSFALKKLNEMKSDSMLYAVNLVNIPGDHPVYSGFPYNGGLIISSTKDDRDHDPYTKNSFSDLYFTKNDGTGWSTPEVMEGLNSKYHDAVAAISPNGNSQ